MGPNPFAPLQSPPSSVGSMPPTRGTSPLLPQEVAATVSINYTNIEGETPVASPAPSRSTVTSPSNRGVVPSASAPPGQQPTQAPSPMATSPRQPTPGTPLAMRAPTMASPSSQGPSHRALSLSSQTPDLDGSWYDRLSPDLQQEMQNLAQTSLMSPSTERSPQDFFMDLLQAHLDPQSASFIQEIAYPIWHDHYPTTWSAMESMDPSVHSQVASLIQAQLTQADTLHRLAPTIALAQSPLFTAHVTAYAMAALVPRQAIRQFLSQGYAALHSLPSVDFQPIHYLARQVTINHIATLQHRRPLSPGRPRTPGATPDGSRAGPCSNPAIDDPPAGETPADNPSVIQGAPSRSFRGYNITGIYSPVRPPAASPPSTLPGAPASGQWGGPPSGQPPPPPGQPPPPPGRPPSHGHPRPPGQGPPDYGGPPHTDISKSYYKGFHPKPDPSAYPSISDPAQYETWRRKMIAHTRAQGLGHVMNPDYVPDNPRAREDFRRMNEFLYAVLQSKVRYTTGERIIMDHLEDANAQLIFTKLDRDNLASTHGRLRTRELRTRLHTLRLDSRWNKPTRVFVHEWRLLADEYNRRQEHKQTRFPDEMLKSLLEAAVASHSALNAVTTRDLERDIGGEQKRYTYPQYLTALEAAATIYDASRSRTSTGDRRSAFLTDVTSDDSTLADHTTDHYGEDRPLDYAAYVASSQPGPRLSQSAYEGLSSESKKLWRQMSPADRTILLKDSGEPSTKTQRSVNVAEQTQVSEVTSETPTEPSTATDTDSSDTLEVNEAKSTSGSKATAHVGDPRRMLSSKGKNPRPALKINTASIIPDPADDIQADLEQYWSVQDTTTDVWEQAPDFHQGDCSTS